jgi:hypothetical protein
MNVMYILIDVTTHFVINCKLPDHSTCHDGSVALSNLIVSAIDYAYC